jgi:hypothetical protein
VAAAFLNSIVTQLQIGFCKITAARQRQFLSSNGHL